ncbi:MAG: protein kinase [Planctomycetaceae bacterium]
MDSLSPELADRLLSLGLCTPADLQRCAARVRRLTRDLPAFDSVWLDALQQAGKLTPFQVRLLNEDPSRIEVGPYLLVDRLGTDGRLTTYTARQPGGKQLIELTLVGTDAIAKPGLAERLDETIVSLRPLRHPGLAVPERMERATDAIVLASRHEAGSTLRELLVRRGRLPIDVVIAIARQLVDSLTLLERVGCVHGDLRQRNVVLTSDGRVVVKQTGVLAAMHPELFIQADVPADCFDGTAPELIDTHRQRNTASEMYALGCLLWELLAGRPPFPHGDPLHKLAAHQGRDIGDVRQWTPAAPTELAGLLLSLTSREPGRRPRSFADLQQRLHRSNGADRRRIRRFVASFQSAAPRLAPSDDRAIRTGRQVASAAAIVLLLGLVAGLWHEGTRAELLNIASQVRGSTLPESLPGEPGGEIAEGSASTTETRTAELDESDNRGARGTPLPLPPASEPGVVRLTGPGPYSASALSAVGQLRVVGDPINRPLILVEASPLSLSGTRVTLENVRIVAADADGDPRPLIEVTAQEFGLVRTTVQGHRSTATRSAPMAAVDHPALIQWRPLDRGEALGGRIGCAHAEFFGTGDVFRCLVSPAQVHLENVLQVGDGAFVRLPDGAGTAATRVTLKRATLRNSTSIVSLSMEPAAAPRIQLTAESSLFAPQTSGALIEVRTSGDGATAQQALDQVRITGSESRLQAGASIAMQLAADGTRQPLDDSEMSIEGLQYAELSFRGPASSNHDDTQLNEQRLSTLPLEACGFDAIAFAGSSPDTYNRETEPAQTPVNR